VIGLFCSGEVVNESLIKKDKTGQGAYFNHQYTGGWIQVRKALLSYPVKQ